VSVVTIGNLTRVVPNVTTFYNAIKDTASTVDEIQMMYNEG
jgi:hypothetical protein